MVSHPMLTFARTSPGRPAFIVLTIAQQHADTPVTLSTDAPDQFQVATDDRPGFSPDLTFTPSLTGTYVHVRYVANQTGLHEGKLFIETPYESRTLALKGSSWSLLPALYTPQFPVRIAKTGQGSRVFSGSWRARIAFAVIIGSLALVSYFYRSQLAPTTTPDRSLTESNQPVTSPLTSRKSLETTAYTTIESGETRTTQSTRKQTRKKRSTNRLSLDSLSDERPVTPPVSAKAVVAPKSSFQTDNRQANAQSGQQPVVVPSPEESELERVLNRKVQQQ
jgi:hypothetical protein